MKPKTAAIVVAVIALPIVLFMSSFGKSEAQGEVALTIMRAFDAEGIGFAFPTTTVELEQQAPKHPPQAAPLAPSTP